MLPLIGWSLRKHSVIVGEPMKVKDSAADPCVFSGEGLLMIIYVDDILVISKDSPVGKRVQDLLNEHVPTKMTGILKPHKVGQVKFVGRVIRRENGSRQLFVGVTPTYLDSCFSDFGLGKLKVGKLVIPNLRQNVGSRSWRRKGISKTLSGELC